MTQNKEKTCFIITPIGDENTEIRRHIDGINHAVIMPVLQDKFSYKISVSHEIHMPGNITKQVILNIRNSDIVIANLTGNNPNVMYEVALRHCFGTAIIMIADQTTIIPADIISERTIFYTNDASGVLELREKLEKAVREIEETGDVIQQGPVYDVLRSAKEEETVMSNVPGGGNKDVLSLIFQRLDKIQDSIDSKNIEPKQVGPEKKNQIYKFYITAETKDGNSSKMNEIAESILKKPTLLLQREIIAVSDNEIKLAFRGPRAFLVTAIENIIRGTFKEHEIEEVKITKTQEEVLVI